MDADQEAEFALLLRTQMSESNVNATKFIAFCRKTLFLEAKEINWEANVWYVEKLNISPERYSLSNTIDSFSFLNIRREDNRKMLQEYLKYLFVVMNLNLGTIRIKQTYIKEFLRYLEEQEKAIITIDAELERSGQFDNTLVIFTSDHGEMLQDKGYYSKELAYEGSVRIPLIVRLPGQLEGGRHVAGFVDTFDILPTCLDACGLVYPDGEMRGKSLLKLAIQTERKLQCSSSGLGYRRWVMCRNERFKYVYHYNGGYEELFDMRKYVDLLTIYREEILPGSL